MQTTFAHLVPFSASLWLARLPRVLPCDSLLILWTCLSFHHLVLLQPPSFGGSHIARSGAKSPGNWRLDDMHGGIETFCLLRLTPSSMVQPHRPPLLRPV